MFSILINDSVENIYGILFGCCDELKLKGIVNLLDVGIWVIMFYFLL